MANCQNYYDCFKKFINDTTIDDLLKTTVGYQQSQDGINAVFEWVEKNAKSDDNFGEFEDIFNSCLIADETMWFNLSWRIGWAAGAVQGLKALGADTQLSNNYMPGVIYSSMDGVS